MVPAVVTNPAVSSESFAVKGTPWSGPTSSPAASCWSASALLERVVGERDHGVDQRIDTGNAVEAGLDDLLDETSRSRISAASRDAELAQSSSAPTLEGLSPSASIARTLSSRRW